MSFEPSPAHAVVATLVVMTACADFRRGPVWDEPSDDASESDAGDDVDADDASASQDGSGSAGDGDDGDDDDGSGAPALTFATDVLPLLRDGCERCHAAGGQASNTAFLLGPDDDAAYTMTLGFIDLDAPGSSRLLAKTAGKGHIGGVIFDDKSSQYETILRWIEDGAMP